MMNDMLSKIQEMKEKIDATRTRLDETFIEGEAGSGTVKVKINANRVVKNVTIDKMMFTGATADELEDLLVIALNRALQKAEQIQEDEMKLSTAGFLPGLQ
jgi:nucleoid-associated protein EbfC